MTLQQLYLVLLAGGLVLLASIVATRAATTVGLPALLLFLGVGVIVGEDGLVPVDYKFFVFSGKVRLFEVDYTRFSRPKQAFFMPDGRRLAVDRGRDVPELLPPLPTQLAEMVDLAEKLGAGHEYIRVDLYDVGGRTYFGELTFYPSGALNLWRPPAFEYEMGAVWREGRAVGEEWVARE